MCKVSILVPVYNVEKYLRQCMDSVVNQTLSDIEIICINDGSTDNSLEILQLYQSKDSRIKIINKENTGYGHSMNQGLRIATGKYVGVVESDDFADASMFEQLFLVAEREQVEIVKSNHWLYSDSGEQLYEMFEGCRYNEVISPVEEKNIFLKSTCIWTSIYRRDFLLENDIWFNETPGASYQDVAFTLKTLACAERVYLVREAYLHYRVDNMNSSVNSRKKVFCDCDEFAELWRYLDERPLLKEKVGKLVPLAMHRIYKWNYGRIAREFKLDFFEQVIKEFLILKEQGILDSRYWKKDSWEEIKNLVELPKVTFYKVSAKIQKMNLLEYGFLSHLRQASRVYIYGAGMIGNRLLQYLNVHDIEVQNILVESILNNPKDIQGIPVCCLEEVFPDEKSVVVMGVKQETQYAVLSILKARKWKNVVLLDSELREALGI